MDMEQEVFPLFASFIRDLGKTYPEIKSSLYRNYEESLVDIESKRIDECPKLQSFLDIVNRNSHLITKKDATFFETEGILEEISFKGLWSKHITDKTRATIWKYFQTFSLLSINLQSGEELQEALRSIHTVDLEDRDHRNMAKELRKVKQLTQGIQESLPKDGEMDGEMDLDGMLGGLIDTNIGKIAQEVAESIDMESLFGSVNDSTNPMDLMSQMMNPEKMSTIFKNINMVMEKKMDDGSLSKDELKKEAEGVYGNMSQNPLFASMMGQMQGGAKEDAGGAKEDAGGAKEDAGGAKEDAGGAKEDARQRLKRCIKEKENERTGG